MCRESLHRAIRVLIVKPVHDAARASRWGSDGRTQESLQDLRTGGLSKKRGIYLRAPENAKGTSVLLLNARRDDHVVIETGKVPSLGAV